MADIIGYSSRSKTDSLEAVGFPLGPSIGGPRQLIPRVNPIAEKARMATLKERPHTACRGLRLGCWSATLLLPILSARGQEALTSAVSLDQAIAAPANELAVQPTAGIKLGPAQLGLGFGVSSAYSDNINGSEYNPEADWYSQFGTTVDLDWAATERSDFHLDSGIGYLYYAHYQSNNGLTVTPNSALTYAVSWDDVTLTAYDQLSYSRQVQTEAALANVSSLPRLDNNAGLRAEYDPGKWTFQASYSYDEYVTDPSTEYLNRSSQYFFGRIGRFTAPESQFGMEISEGLTAYEQPIQPNSDNFSIGLYAELQLLASLELTVRGGPSADEYLYPAGSGGNLTVTSYYFTVSLTHQLTDYLSQSIEIDRSTQPGLVKGTAYIEQLTASYTLSYNLTQFISLSGTLSVEDGSQPYTKYISFHGIPIAIPGTENYTRYGVALSAGWQIAKHWNCNLSVNRFQRESNLPGDSYNEDTVSAGINYTF